MIIADISGLLAFFNRNEPAHAAVVGALDAHDGHLVVSPFVIAELDYLVATQLGLAAELTVLSELAGGAYDIASFSASKLRSCADVIAAYPDQEIGVTDASLVVLADRFETNRVLTLDRRHFDVLRPLAGGHFELVGA